ncbi:uncharacterized protein LOC115422368 [Sphaeramia orbicularis]|uniref:uncharacterized protein LOC115422368 n=1 Tax=Sphaeramia orbicularis TaxID=375764 RepID=UPI00118095E9|nr:uncharacterized protein LOC115422368 [Sphaeramia orbicularis]
MTRTHWTIYARAGVFSGKAQKQTKKKEQKNQQHLLLASFLALALDLILSACRFLSSSSVSPEAATTLSSSHQHCQFGHLRTCAQAIQSDTLAGAKKLSNVFIIITFFFCPIVSPLDHLSLPLLLFLLLLRSPHHLTFPPSLPPLTRVPLLTPAAPPPPPPPSPFSFCQQPLGVFSPLTGRTWVFCNLRWTQRTRSGHSSCLTHAPAQSARTGGRKPGAFFFFFFNTSASFFPPQCSGLQQSYLQQVFVTGVFVVQVQLRRTAYKGGEKKQKNNHLNRTDRRTDGLSCEYCSFAPVCLFVCLFVCLLQERGQQCNGNI